VLTYVRNSFGNKADPVSIDFVAAVRKEVENKGEWRIPALEAFRRDCSSDPCSGGPRRSDHALLMRRSSGFTLVAYRRRSIPCDERYGIQPRGQRLRK